MQIQWNRVTWYSKLAALVLALAILCLGIYLGMSYQSYIDTGKSAQPVYEHK